MIFNQAFENVKNKLKSSRNYELKEIVYFWLEELNLPSKLKHIKSSVYSDFEEWLSDNYADVGENENPVRKIAFNVYNELLKITGKEYSGGAEQAFFNNPLNPLNVNKFTTFIKKLVTTIKNNKEEQMKNSIILIAFVVTAIGISLFLLKKDEKKQKNELNQSSKLEPDTKRLPPQIEKKLLLLVINADKFKSVISTLENNKKINESDGKALYQATKYLWMGNEDNFIKLNFQQSFEESEVTEEWEYDVKLVQIKLKDFDSGFEPDTINRLPAFLKLHKIAEEVKISKRLSSKAYENPNLYR